MWYVRNKTQQAVLLQENNQLCSGVVWPDVNQRVATKQKLFFFNIELFSNSNFILQQFANN